MAIYEVKLAVDGSRIDAVRKQIATAFPEANAVIEKVNLDKSRADRLSEAEALVTDAKSAVEELRDEIQNWYDSLPENLQQSEKANQLEECVSNLDDLCSSLEDAESNFGNVEFPGMY